MIKRINEKYKSLPIEVRATVWFVICAFLQRGVSLITTPIFTRLLSPEEYGSFNVFNSWLSILTVFCTLNMYYGVFTQGLIKFEENRNRFSSSVQSLCTLLVLIWTFIYFAFSSFWNKLFDLTTVQMSGMLIIIWCSALFTFWSAEKRVDYNYKSLVSFTLVLCVLQPILSVFLILHSEDKVTARILGIVIGQLVMCPILYLFQMKRDHTFFDKEYWPYMLRMCIPLIPHYLSQVVLAGSDRIMIKNIVGQSEAGIYSLAYSISQMLVIFNTALLNAISPWMIRKIKDKNVHEISRIAYPSFIMIAIMNLLVMVLAPEVIAIFAPKTYYEAIWVIPPVSMSVFYMFSYTFFAEFELFFEKTHFITIASLTAAGLNLLLNYLFISRFGYIAAGYTTVVCYLIFTIFHYWFVKRLCKTNLDDVQPYNGKLFSLIAFSFMLAGFCIMFTYNYPLLRYGIIALIVIVCVIKRDSVIDRIKQIIEVRNEQ